MRKNPTHVLRCCHCTYFYVESMQLELFWSHQAICGGEKSPPHCYQGLGTAPSRTPGSCTGAAMESWLPGLRSAPPWREGAQLLVSPPILTQAASRANSESASRSRWCRQVQEAREDGWKWVRRMRGLHGCRDPAEGSSLRARAGGNVTHPSESHKPLPCGIRGPSFPNGKKGKRVLPLRPAEATCAAPAKAG